MKYEFEIRGEFEIDDVPSAEMFWRKLVERVGEIVKQLNGRITGRQLNYDKPKEKYVTRQFIEDDWKIGHVEFYNNSIVVNLSKIKDD